MTHPDELKALLDEQRELTEDEQSRLRHVTEDGWNALVCLERRRSEATYSTSEPEEFRQCVMNHMDAGERAEMVTAEAYTCPECHRLLKDRHTPVASAILLERARVARLWRIVEATPEKERPAAIAKFRKALNL